MRIPKSCRNGFLMLALGGAVSAIPTGTQPAFAAESGGKISEVVVTAQFRRTELQKTPLAITAITGDDLRVRGQTSVTDLAATVPNAVIQPLGAGWGATEAAFIRGIGLGDNILSFEPGVPIYIDGVYNGRPQGSIFDLLDLERVEVLRGPQGTLFGKNAVGGAVNLISKKPDGSNTGYLEASTGSYKRANIRGAWDASIVPDKLFARLAVSTKNADGYFKVLDYACVNGAAAAGNLGSAVGQTARSCVADRLGGEGVTSGRLAVRYVASSTVEANVVADFTRQRQNGPADKYTVIANSSDPASGGGFLNYLWSQNVSIPQFGLPYDSRFITNSPYTNYSRYSDPISNRSVPNINNMDHWGVSGTLDWDATDYLHLKSITAYRNWWNKFGRDSDGSPLPANATYDDSRHNQFTEEVRATGSISQLDYAAGVFYYHANDSNQGFDFLLPGIIYNQDSFDRQTTKDWAFYVHADYHITDKLDLTAGVRYTKDKKNATLLRVNIAGTQTVPNVAVNVSASRWKPMAELSYQWTSNVMTYVLYSTGFRGGGFSPRPSNALQVTSFGPEDVTNYEVGIKSEWFDHRLRLNADYFYMQDNHQQNYKNDQAPAGVPWFHAVNGGDSTNQGVELELDVAPIDGLDINASLGYLSYKLKDNAARRTVLLCTVFSNGDTCYPPRAPKWSYSFGIQYAEDLGDLGVLTPRVDVQGYSRIYFATYNDSCPVAMPTGGACPVATIPAANPTGGIGYQSGYSLVNARLTWDSSNRNWEVALSAKNLTNKVYFYGKLSLVALLGREQGNVAPPREWMLTVRRNF